MARMQGVEPHEAGILTRFVYWLARRKIGQLTGKRQVVEPIKITAHHSRLFKAYGQMEMRQDAARSVPAGLKALAALKTAMLIGCPF